MHLYNLSTFITKNYDYSSNYWLTTTLQAYTRLQTLVTSRWISNHAIMKLTKSGLRLQMTTWSWTAWLCLVTVYSSLFPHQVKLKLDCQRSCIQLYLAQTFLSSINLFIYACVFRWLIYEEWKHYQILNPMQTKLSFDVFSVAITETTKMFVPQFWGQLWCMC